MTQETRKYMVKGWGSKPFSSYLCNSCSRGSGPHLEPMTYIPCDSYNHKEQEYIWCRGRDLDRFQDIRALPV